MKLGVQASPMPSKLSRLTPLIRSQQGIDTTTPAGKMMFQVLGSFAEYERDMIRARVNAGIARAKAAGKHCGRPPLAPELAERIRQAMAVPGRPGIRVIAKQFFMVASKFPGLSWLRGSDARADSGSTP